MPISKDATLYMTLDEINKRDIDNFNLLANEMTTKLFHKKHDAAMFMGRCLRKALLSLGIEINPKVLIATRTILSLYNGFRAAADDVDKQLEKKGVRVERRSYREKEDLLRSGIYIYYQNEIAYFISDPLVVTIRGRRGIMVRTNVTDNVQLLVRRP